MTARPTVDRQWYRFAAVLALGLAVGAGFAAMTDDASASADMDLQGLNVTDVNDTVTGNVTGVDVTADLAYQYTAPDAEQVIVELKAGRSADTLSAITFRRMEVSGSGSGDVTLTGSIADAGIDPLTLDPSVGGTVNETLYVAASIRVDRANGDTIEHTTVEPVRLTLRDDATLSATVAGNVSLTVQTSG